MVMAPDRATVRWLTASIEREDDLYEGIQCQLKSCREVINYR